MSIKDHDPYCLIDLIGLTLINLVACIPIVLLIMFVCWLFGIEG